MYIRRLIIVVAALTLLALGAGVPRAVAQPTFGGSLTITALSPDTTTPYSGTQDFIYIQLSGNAPSGGTVVTRPVPTSPSCPSRRR